QTMNPTTSELPRLSEYTPNLAQHHAALDAVRYIGSWIRVKGDRMLAPNDFAENYPTAMHKNFIVARSAVAVGTTTDTTWAGPLARYTPLTDALVALARAASVLGAIPYSDVPPSVTLPVMNTGVVAGWIGEAAPTPVSKQGFVSVALDLAK